MTRTLGDIPMPEEQWPPEGETDCRCYTTEMWVSPKKGTPAVRLLWVSLNGVYNFSDLVFVTAKTLSRLNLVAQRVCGAEKTMPLPDVQGSAEEQNLATAKFLGRYILENAKDKCATVIIEEQTEEFLNEQGQKKTKQRPKVGFSGYKTLTDTPSDTKPKEAGWDKPEDGDDDGIPF